MRINRPSLLELECFVTVAEELNFSRAARRLNLSQAPLSRHIQALEEKLGDALFLRNTRSVSLAPAGKIFLEDARRILRLVNASVDAVRRSRAGETSRLRTAFIGALLDEPLVHLLRRFRDAHPACQIQLSDLAPAAQMDGLVQGAIDVGFVGVAPARLPKNLAAIVWKREPLKIALPAAHRLAKAKGLRFADLAGEGWILVARKAAPAFRAYLDRFLEKTALRLRIVEESERIAAVLSMVAAGQGVSVVPSSVEKLIGSEVIFRPITAPKPPLLEHSCVHTTQPNPEVERFIALLRHRPRGAAG